MHAARIDNSPRLQRVLGLLMDGEEHSTLDVVNRAQVCAVNSAVSELRTHGYDIACWNKGRVFYYRMDSMNKGEVK